MRKIALETAPGLFGIETIRRTSYRLTGEILAGAHPASRATADIGLPRRAVAISAGGLVLAGSAGAGLWSIRSSEERRFDDLLERGEDALDFGDGSIEPARYLEEAVATRPDHATAQGLLAMALMSYVSTPANPRKTPTLERLRKRPMPRFG